MKHIFFLLATTACAQTQIDLGAQSRNIDFSAKSMVRPFRMGTQLPSTCLTGEMFFNTNASAGLNAYGCTAPDIWTLQGSSNSAPLQVTLTTPTTLQVGSACNIVLECRVRVGSVVYSYPAPATITVQSGTGSVYIFVNSAGVISAGNRDAASPVLSCSGCQVLNSVDYFPPDCIPLAVWNASSGVWDSGGTDVHALLSAGRTLVAGPNIILTESGSTVTIAATVANPAGGSELPEAPTSGVYDSTDMTTFDRSYVFSETGYNAAAPWTYAGGGCGASGPTTGAPGEVPGLGWGTYSNKCVVVYPGGNGGAYPLTDFLSGKTPLAYTLKARYALSNSGGPGTGTHYIGWSSGKDGTFTNFVGLRYVATDDVWQCIIRAGDTDIASQILPATPDAAVHTFTVANDGRPNSVTCKVDGDSTTATGPIAAAAWYGVMGARAASGGTSNFTTVEARIRISGIKR